MEVIEATAVLLQLSRKHMGDFTELQVNNNASLRKRLSKNIMAEAKASYPNVTTETWTKASQKLCEY